MFQINSPLSSFEVTNLIDIFAPILGPFTVSILSIFNKVPFSSMGLALGFNNAPFMSLGLGLGFYIKLFFVFFLILVNLYLVLSHNKEEVNKVNFLQSGPGGKNPKESLIFLGVAAGHLASFITLKNECSDTRLDALNTKYQLLFKLKLIKEGEAKVEDLNKKINDQWDTLLAIRSEKTTEVAGLLRLKEINLELSKDIARFRRKTALSEEATASDLIVLCDALKVNIGKYEREFGNLDDKIVNYITDLNVKSANSVNSDGYHIEGLAEGSDIHKSSIFNFDFDFDFSIEWFEGLRGHEKLAVVMILGKTIILSALISIVFIHYGDILIKRYDLVNKYPKLAKFIELRRKYQKYYFIYSCLLILSVVITEIVSGLSILAIPFF